ncbi:MAG: hypothetical protein ACI4W2_01215 [Eubacterium sp.]
MKQSKENYWLMDAPVAKAIWHMAIPLMLGIFIFQAKREGTPAVIMSVMRGIILIPAIAIGNYLLKLNGVIFSLLIAEAIPCITGFVLYISEQKHWKIGSLLFEKKNSNTEGQKI